MVRCLKILLVASSLVCSFISNAATVTTPVGVLNNPAPTNASDPFLPDTWLRLNVRNDGSVGITADYPRSGSGSVFLSLGNNTGNNAKADWEFYPSAGFGRLADLNILSYEWYRDAVSQVPAHLHPVLRILIDADGNLTTTNDRGYLVYERCYNFTGCPAVPTNVWTADAITTSSILWWVQFGVGIDTVYTRSLATYQTGAYTPSPGFSQITGNSLILGVSAGIGSGWTASAPSFRGAIDNITLTSSTPGANSITNTNFELAQPIAVPIAVPTLHHAALLLMASLLSIMALGYSQAAMSRMRGIKHGWQTESFVNLAAR